MANTKISDLSALSEKPATGDVLPIVDVSGTPTTKKITVANLFKSDLVGNVTGNVTGDVTGNVTGNTSGTAATVTTAAQPTITSLGTLTSLTIASAAPANATAPGTAGTIAWEAGFLYVCTSANVWQRVVIATF
jgi:hypothetical protein